MTLARSAGPELPDKSYCGLLGGGERLLHAGARVNQQRQCHAHVGLAKERDVLRPAVFQHCEIADIKVRDVPLGSIGDGHVEQDDIDARPKPDTGALCPDGRPVAEDRHNRNKPNSERQTSSAYHGVTSQASRHTAGTPSIFDHGAAYFRTTPSVSNRIKYALNPLTSVK